MNCEYCGSLIPFGVSACPSCGAPCELVPDPDDSELPTSAGSPKSKAVFILLAVFLGMFGAHNFYIDQTVFGIIQLCITVLSGGSLTLISWIWAIVEAFKVRTDASGRPFAQ